MKEIGNLSNGIDQQLIAKVIAEVKRQNQSAAKAPPRAKAKAESPPAKPAAQTKWQREQEPREKPVHVIKTDDVVTRIWANKTALGGIQWSIDQRRYRTDGWGGPNCKTLHAEHLSSAIRGLYQAQQWIRKTERRLKWRRLWS